MWIQDKMSSTAFKKTFFYLQNLQIITLSLQSKHMTITKNVYQDMRSLYSQDINFINIVNPVFSIYETDKYK